VTVTENGVQAWEILRGSSPPQLCILDWMMPEMDGVVVCRRARTMLGQVQLYIILLTALDSEDVVTKRFDHRELHARIDVGKRILDLQSDLSNRIRELEASIVREKTLQGLLPICSYCKKVRDDQNYWQQVEGYIEDHADVSFSHGICPDCYTNIVEPQLEQLKNSGPEGKGSS
jgi:sigma-B regulation protein RsbU (phosphoserine phosphatase)